ncbi:uncharacterized protein LOC134461475 [Engraulis encrasicolus]|uniref:uncharacterized protein LOC134461475 n=1 Tax=Engraulis encrasicolus TaxID=184585 RepID=UPI002FD63625
MTFYPTICLLTRNIVVLGHQFAKKNQVVKEEDIYDFLPEYLYRPKEEENETETSEALDMKCETDSSLTGHNADMAPAGTTGEKNCETKDLSSKHKRTHTAEEHYQHVTCGNGFTVSLNMIKEEDIYDFLPEHLYTPKEEENETKASDVKEEALDMKCETDSSLTGHNADMAPAANRPGYITLISLQEDRTCSHLACIHLQLEWLI